MSIELRCTIGAIASKKARSALAGEAADGVGERRRGEGAGRDDHLIPVGRRQRDLLAPDLDQRVRRDRGRTAAANPSRSTASAPPAGT